MGTTSGRLRKARCWPLGNFADEVDVVRQQLSVDIEVDRCVKASRVVVITRKRELQRTVASHADDPSACGPAMQSFRRGTRQHRFSCLRAELVAKATPGEDHCPAAVRSQDFRPGQSPGDSSGQLDCRPSPHDLSRLRRASSPWCSPVVAAELLRPNGRMVVLVGSTSARNPAPSCSDVRRLESSTRHFVQRKPASAASRGRRARRTLIGGGGAQWSPASGRAAAIGSRIGRRPRPARHQGTPCVAVRTVADRTGG